MDTISSENCIILDDILKEETDHLVRISQSNSDLLNEPQGVQVVNESRDEVPIRPWNANLKEEKSDGVPRVPESQSQN